MKLIKITAQSPIPTLVETDDKDMFELKTLQQHVGGYIEYINLDLCNDGYVVYCDDEGKLKGLPVTAAIINPETDKLVDVLCGNIVIVKGDGEGNDIGVDENDLEFITKKMKLGVLIDETRRVPVFDTWKYRER